jgi:hypothetical protein
MDDPTVHIKTLIETTKHYVQESAELYKLKAIDKASEGISTFSARIILIPFAILFFIMMNIAISLWLGELLHKNSYGFFITGGTYGLVGVIVYLFGNKLIKTPLKNIFIKYALKIEMPWTTPKTPEN